MLNASDLRREQIIYKEAKIQTYNIILDKCMNRMKKASQKGKKNLWFKVPYFLVGYPLYDYDMCLAHIIKCLRSNDYFVRFHAPSYLFVSWDDNPEDDDTTKFIEAETKKTNKFLKKEKKPLPDITPTIELPRLMPPINNNYVQPNQFTITVQPTKNMALTQNRNNDSLANNKQNILTFLKIKQLNKN